MTESLRVGKPLPNVRSQTLDELTAWVESRGFPAYRGAQVTGWLYNRPLTAVEDMHNLPALLREALLQDFDCSFPSVAKRSDSVDGTSKLLIGLGDAKVVESVIIPRDDRITLCISSQVGCALDCQFCATATLGLQRNLEPGEIVGQVLRAREAAAPNILTNYVFMGMGEPLANYDRLLRALDDPHRALGAGHIAATNHGLDRRLGAADGEARERDLGSHRGVTHCGP